MAFRDIFSAANISSSGLSAERLRMEVVANNIANAFSTRSPDGGPFRRQDVIFSAVLNDRLSYGAVPGQELLGGVQPLGVIDDPSPFIREFNPAHPDADTDGFVLLPNIQLPLEMVNLITANRAYEANLKVLQSYIQQSEQAILLIRT